MAIGVVDEIKERIDLLQVIQERVTLKRAGKNWVGQCPFHEERTPSFTVFPNSNTWKCFGACKKGGDVFDFIQEINGWEFKEALRHLAQRAGVELRPLTQEEERTQTLRREREEILTLALPYFQERMLAENSPGFEYAHQGRGWSRELIEAAGLGWFGKDWPGLRAYMERAGIDPDAPAAVALVGYRGDVKGWAAAHQVQADEHWIEQGKIPAMPPEMLIYPHLWRGTTVYLAGRRLGDGPKSWNPPESLAGPRQPAFNHLWFKGDPKGRQFVIVEGQGDAVTLAGWEIPAVALAGSAVARTADNNRFEQAILRAVNGGGRVLSGMDSDEAGAAGTEDTARALMEMGLTPLQFGLVEVPAPDWNDWARGKGFEGAEIPAGDARAATALLSGAKNWLQRLILRAKEDDDDQRRLFDALARLDPYEVERWRPVVSENLNLRMQTFDGLLKAARRGLGMGDDGKPAYLFMGDGTWYRTFDQYGEEKLVRLAHFQAWIAEDVLRDDGQDVKRELRCAGKVNGTPLALARVDAGEYNQMNWIMREWGSRAIVEAGSRIREHLRTAIQLLSKEIKRQRIYTHTGWRELDDGRMVYLTSCGAIGEPSIEVDLDRDLTGYAIPLQPEKPKEAMELSLQILDLAPERVTFPVWAAVWLAPLRELIDAGFMMWVYGMTGSLKSTFVALALNHYGPTFTERTMPADYISTANSLAYKAFITKDALLVIDDFAPQSTRRSQEEYRAKAERLAREAGNAVGRGRMRSDGTAQTTYAPRGLVISTGEDLQGVEGIISRMFVVEVQKNDIRANLEMLTRLQHVRDRYCHAMSGYLQWVSENWATLKEKLPAKRETYRRRAMADDLHLRFPEAMASLAVGLEMGLRYAVHVGALSQEMYEINLETGWQAMRECVANMADVAAREKPQELFVQAVGNLLTMGKIYLRQRGGAGLLGGSDTDRAELAGWYDDTELHFISGTIYSQVYRYYREQGGVFPQTELMMRKTLAEVGYSVTEAGRYDRRVVVEGDDGNQERPRLLSIRREVIPMETAEIGVSGSSRGPFSPNREKGET